LGLRQKFIRNDLFVKLLVNGKCYSAQMEVSLVVLILLVSVFVMRVIGTKFCGMTRQGVKS